MAIDSLSLSILTKELKNTLCGGKISKIFQPEKDEIILQIYQQKGYRLVLSANASINRLHLCNENKENPKNALTFCMLLRKHITNATIENITQMPYERVVDFTLQARNELGYQEEKHLIFELTGKTSNLILCDANYNIFDMLKHLPLSTDSERIIVAGAKYTFFEDRHLLKLEQKEEISALITASEESIDKLLRENLLGVSSQAVAEILFGVEKDNHSSLNAQRIINGIDSFISNLNHPMPNVVIQNDVLLDAFPFDFKSIKGEKIYFDSLNSAHEYFYTEKDKQMRFSQKAKSVATALKNTVSRLEKKIGIQAQELAAAQDNTTNKLYGDLILANLHLVCKNAQSVTVTNYYDEDCKTVEIPLDKSRTAQQNAQEYYKKYHKQKNTVLYVTQLLEENKNLLQYALSIKQSLANCDSPAELNEIYTEMAEVGFIKGKKKETIKNVPSQPLHYLVQGFNVIVGKNNTQNDTVTHKIAKADDLWLHTQNMQSAHVVIVSEGKKIPQSVVVIAAEICAHYSQAKYGGKTAVDYCYKKFVKKPPKAKPGFVIYTDYSTLIVLPNQHLDLVK